MLCQNCGKNEVNFRYTQIVNGVKKEMALCDKCAKSLGLESLDFNMPINFSNFFGDFLNVAADNDFLPSFTKTGTLECNNCGMTYNEFVNTGKFGCSHCYSIFKNFLDPVLKNIHGSNTHIGRKAISSNTNKTNKVDAINNDNINTSNIKMKKAKEDKEKTSNKAESKEEKILKLNNDLKLAIKEERYEDAAKIRDEIKSLEK